MDNPIFLYYGRICERYFVGDLESTQLPSIFSNSIVNNQTSSEPDSRPEQLADYADANQMEKINRAITRLRLALKTESTEPGFRLAPTANKLDLFQKGLAQGSEAMLSENPFYELTVLIYQTNLKAVQNFFVERQKNLEINLPQPIKVSRSLGHLWGREGAMVPVDEKIKETLGKVLSVGKIFLGLLLFIGSTLTTAKGVNDLLQLDGFVSIFGDFFLGEKHEIIRLVLTLTVGTILSSIILDFKSRLFQGIAEAGKVFSGFVDAFKRFPRWMFLSLFFTMASIWTNYDGIVLLFSKTQDLSYQSEVIQQQVHQALGDPKAVDPDDPDSLADLQALLHKKILTSSRQFEQVVEDEMMGVASSGIAQKGPRYWAKYFIVHGGYKPGQADVVHALNGNRFNQQLDRMLQRSNLDLSRPLRDQLQSISTTYNSHHDRTRETVVSQMDDLAHEMTLQSYSLQELTALFQLEAYHVNSRVQAVVRLMSENKEAFGQAAQEINRLAQAHIDLLREVDKVGIPSNTEYTIDVQIEIPRVDAIDQLNQSKIPMAKRRSLIELKELLMERYGAAIGSSILFGILFIAVFMDLSDPIFYSTMVARWGRKDRHFLEENIKRFQSWEAEYIQNIRAFLTRPDIRATLPQLSCPKTSVLHWSYHQHLETLAPSVKDYSRLTIRERFRFWFLGLFSTTRIRYTEIYNARQSITRKILSEPRLHLSSLLNFLYGNIFHTFSIGYDHFDSVYQNSSQRMNRNALTYQEDLKDILSWIHKTSEVNGKKSGADSERLLRQAVLARMNANFRQLVLNRFAKSSLNLFHTIFLKPLSRSHFDFPLTRNSWMVDQAVRQINSQSLIADLAKYTDGITTLLKLEIPRIKKQTLTPLLRLFDKIPNQQALDRTMQITALHHDFLIFEGDLFCLFGMSQSRDVLIDESLYQSIRDNAGSKEVAAIYDNKNGSITTLEMKVGNLEKKLSLAQTIVSRLLHERSQIVSALTEARVDCLRPIELALIKLNHAALLEDALGLFNMRRNLASLDSFMIDLWGGGDADKGLIGERVDQVGGMNPVFTRITLEEENREDSLLTYAISIKEQMSVLKREMDSKMFLLSFLDQTIEKNKQLIDESFQFIATLFIEEARLISGREKGEPDALDQLGFIEDHLVYLRSIPLFLENSREAFFDIARLRGFIESGDVEPLRKLGNQVFKVHGFLKNSLAFLAGERERSRISVPLDVMQELVTGHVE
ncbi:MAG: hypothetical protein HQL67_11870 [Magnetococcales bacterium]|nr:hypothetical protein [Magnetococcales bacterium]